MASDVLTHRLKNLALILISLVFIPLDTLILALASLSDYLLPSPARRRRDAALQTPGFKPSTILVTGVGMTKGLVLARTFWEAGHDVIGADFESSGALVCGRTSKSLKKFVGLQAPNVKAGSIPYVESLLQLVVAERVDLWVSCSGVASAVEDGEAKEIIEAKTGCRAIQFDVKTTRMLHEKDSFIERTKEIGLTIPETHSIDSLEKVEEKLRAAPKGRKFIMKPIGMDDANRGDMTLLPKASPAETSAHLSNLRISDEEPWILQQFIQGPEYCTHALVVRGKVKVFVACPSAELLMHYEALPSDSKLSRAMLAFTERYATAGGKEFTGHLSFDFMIDKQQMNDLHSIHTNEEPILYPIECNPRAHTAVVLFNGVPDMSKAYLSLLERSGKGTARQQETITTPQSNDKYFWIGHDLFELCIQPLLAILLFRSDASFRAVTRGVATFIEHVLFWRDGTFERWDAVPWWWLYHVYWPLCFFNALKSGKKWSRINVSTTKMFEC